MGRQQPIGMYRGVKFAEKGLEYERHYRLANSEIIRWLKPKRGTYKRITRCGVLHKKAKPGTYRKQRRRRNAYVINQD